MGQEVKDHLRRALSLMFKPLVRLLIAQGVTHAELSETAKEVYVEVALRHFESEGRVNRSKVAILTGLTRKEVKNVIDRTLEWLPRKNLLKTRASINWMVFGPTISRAIWHSARATLRIW